MCKLLCKNPDKIRTTINDTRLPTEDSRQMSLQFIVTNNEQLSYNLKIPYWLIYSEQLGYFTRSLTPKTDKNSLFF